MKSSAFFIGSARAVQATPFTVYRNETPHAAGAFSTPDNCLIELVGIK